MGKVFTQKVVRPWPCKQMGAPSLEVSKAVDGL